MIVTIGTSFAGSPPGSRQPVQAALDRLGRREGLRDGERDRRVDADAAGRGLFDGDDAGRGRRELDVEVGGQAGEADGLLDHPRRVAVVGRVRLDRQPALPAGRLGVDRERAAPRRRTAISSMIAQVSSTSDQVGFSAASSRTRGTQWRLLLADHFEHDRRVRGGAGGAALDGVRQLLDRARVVPVVGWAEPRRAQQRTVDRGHGHASSLASSWILPRASIIDDR